MNGSRWCHITYVECVGYVLRQAAFAKFAVAQCKPMQSASEVTRLPQISWVLRMMSIGSWFIAVEIAFQIWHHQINWPSITSRPAVLHNSASWHAWARCSSDLPSWTSSHRILSFIVVAVVVQRQDILIIVAVLMVVDVGKVGLLAVIKVWGGEEEGEEGADETFHLLTSIVPPTLSSCQQERGWWKWGDWLELSAMTKTWSYLGFAQIMGHVVVTLMEYDGVVGFALMVSPLSI